MEKKAREKVLEIIRQIINDTSIDTLSNFEDKQRQQQEKIKRTKSQLESQVDLDLFYGGNANNNIKKKININENAVISITTQEIKQFQKDMYNHLSGNAIEFENQVVNGKQSILSFPIKNNKLDIITKGTIDNKIDFTMSLNDGFIINMENFVVNESNNDVISKVFNLYNTIFKKRFSELLSSAENN